MIENIAQKLQDNLVYKQKVVVDPATIMLIITLVSTIISAIQKCKEKPKDATVMVNHPTPREKRMLKVHIRKHLGLWKYLTQGKQYQEAVLATGKTLTTGEMESAYGELRTMEFRK